MWLMRFTFNVLHIPGKALIITDTLPCAPSAMPSDVDTHFNQDTEMFVASVVSYLPANEKRLIEKQEEDEVCKHLKQYCQSGWPNKHQVPETLKPYYSVSSELTTQHSILMRNNRIVIPSSLHEDMLMAVETRPPYRLYGVLV